MHGNLLKERNKFLKLHTVNVLTESWQLMLCATQDDGNSSKRTSERKFY